MTDRERVNLLVSAAGECLAEMEGRSRQPGSDAIEQWRRLLQSTPVALIKACGEAWLNANPEPGA